MPKACFCWILFWSGSVFATSPVPIHFSMAGESVLLACDVEWPNENAIGEISYQWYLGAEPIEGATGYEYATEEFDQAGCRQYNCVKKNLENLDADDCRFHGLADGKNSDSRWRNAHNRYRLRSNRI